MFNQEQIVGRCAGACLLGAALASGYSTQAAALVSPSTLVAFVGVGDVEVPRGLYNVDPDSLATTFRTAVEGAEDFRSLALIPGTETAYAATLDGGLWTLDLNTGQSNLIGNTGLNGLDEVAVNPLTGEVFGLVSDGTRGSIYEIDPMTSQPSLLVANTDVESALAFSNDGTLYGLDFSLLFTVDTTDGTVQRAFLPGLSTPRPSFTLSDATLGPDGRYYALEFLGGFIEVDYSPPFGGGTLITEDFPLRGATAIVSIPEPSSAALLGLAGCIIARRRRG